MLSSRRCRGAFVAGLLVAEVCGQTSQPVLRSSAASAENATQPTQAFVTTDSHAERFARENDAIWAGLRGPLRGFEFKDLPLDQAIDTILNQSPIRNWHVRWQVLVDQGIARDKPITAKLRDSTIQRAIELILEEAGGADIRMAYEPIDGVLIVSTEEDVYRRLESRVYPIGDLITGDLARMRQRLAALRGKSEHAPDPISADAHFRAAIERMKAAEAKPGTGDDSDDDDDRRSSPLIATINLIQNSIEPDAWTVNGGTGTIGAFSDSLVVRNNVRVHRTLSRLLNDLRAAEVANADRKQTGGSGRP
jgi:hypothetical protein